MERTIGTSLCCFRCTRGFCRKRSTTTPWGKFIVEGTPVEFGIQISALAHWLATIHASCIADSSKTGKAVGSIGRVSISSGFLKCSFFEVTYKRG